MTQADGSDLPQWLGFDATTLTFSGTPQDADVGSLQVTVIATDTTGLTGRTTFDLTVQNVNDPPSAVTPIPDQSATEDSTWTYVLPENAFTDRGPGFGRCPDLERGEWRRFADARLAPVRPGHADHHGHPVPG